MTFIPSTTPVSPDTGKAWVFLFDPFNIVVDEKTGRLPLLEPELARTMARSDLGFFGFLDQVPCGCGIMDPDQLRPGLVPLNFRKFYHSADEDLRMAVACGRPLADLRGNFRFCGKCGREMLPMDREHARICPACGLVSYPRISPAVIMAVTKGDQILLARGKRFPNPAMFSVLAGFVSPGETLEACVAREVYEETRIRVGQIRYVTSQPWPFPDSLMIGFTAEYEGGDIVMDPEEIADAAWFKADSMPLIPNNYSVAGQLIRDFIRGRGGFPPD